MASPGKYQVAFGPSTNIDQIAFKHRREGFEVRDCLALISGKGTLGILLRQPFEATVHEQLVRHGTGALNIEAGRVATTESLLRTQKAQDNGKSMSAGDWKGGTTGSDSGRFPSNFILQHTDTCETTGCSASCPIQALDEQSGILTSGRLAKDIYINRVSTSLSGPTLKGYSNEEIPANSGGASRFFYNATSEEDMKAYLRGITGD